MVKKATAIKEKISHRLMGEHILLSEEEKQKVLSYYKTKESCLPVILLSDPALIGLDAKVGDIVLIKRKDLTGEYNYYRIVQKG
ncbi:MAG: DNA-directed RNA polymerase subunit RpoH/Rpb5 C-terminal domain-containing protein [Candidatus Anstonellaceae archaeon]